MADREEWTYDKLRRRWVAAVPNPSTPAPTAPPEGTAYGDWPRCRWPAGCTIGVKDRPLCSPHSELTLAYGHDLVAIAGTGATPSWQRCATCGVRGAMHGRLREVEEAAVLVWLEENPDVVLDPPPPSAHTERLFRTPDVINVRSDAETPPTLMLTAAEQAAHLAAPPVSSPKVREDARPTSREAAAKVAPSATTQRGRVLRVVVYAGDEGATDEQISDRLGMPLNTVRPRRLELVEQGYVIDSGDTAPTRSGSAAVLWLATLEAVQAVADA